MPLTEYPASLARLLSEYQTFDSYLAGGAAILIEPNATRFSRDLDYFHDSESRVVEAFSADRELFVDSCPPEEIGCLYYSASRRGFVDPQTVEDAKPHFGRPGGVLPRITDRDG